jgi:hypothetical protein
MKTSISQNWTCSRPDRDVILANKYTNIASNIISKTIFFCTQNVNVDVEDIKIHF